MPLMDFTDAYTGGPGFYTGTGTSALVPDVFPVAINGRPYMIDRKSQQFVREFEPRVRDSSDDSTSPGEAAISTEGLWRRGQKSWHFGAGQFYADDAEAADYRFYKSKGVNPWVKGRLTLLNDTVLRSASTFTGTNLKLVEVNNYLYVSDGQTLKYTTDPFAATPSWTSVTTNAPTATINDIATDGIRVYVAYENNSIYITTPGTSTVTKHFLSNSNINFTRLGFAKGFMMAYHPDTAESHIHIVPFASSTSKDTTAKLRDPNFICAGFAGGQNHIYVAGRSTDTGVVYRLGIKADGTVDVAIVALELPVGEYPTAIYSYLGSIMLGTNKGVRVCTSDSSGSLVSGALIPTGGDVLGFTAEDRFVWFTWSNYDGVSGGLGRLDLSRFIATNTPSFATDLMYTSNAQVRSVESFGGKRVFSISGVGVVVENQDALVPEGSIETGNFTWDIVDPKFSPRFDVRMTPLVGSISVSVALDNQDYEPIGVHSDAGDTEHAYIAPETNFIEAAYKITLTRATTTTGPTFTRWMSRAYAAPKRSRIITLPLLIHEHMSIHGRDYYFDVTLERDELEALADNPRIVTYQEQGHTLSVIVENTQFQANFTSTEDWLWEGTMIVQMRTVAE
jgi:hypothetical protein